MMPPHYRLAADELNHFPWDCSSQSRVKPQAKNAEVDGVSV